jgi:hypothetical protein
MGNDAGAPRPSRSLASIAKGLRLNYPSIVQSLGQQVLPQAEYEQAAQEAIAPREAALNAGIYSQFAPVYSQAAAGADLAALEGSGGQSVRAADALSRSIDPEYYASRTATADKLGALLGGMDPNSLTGSELENVARGIARTNPNAVGVPSNTSAIRNALTFGNALTQKRNSVSQAIAAASQVLPQFRSGVDVFGQATGRAGTSAFGGGFNTNASSVGNAQQGGQNAFNQTTGLQQLRAQLQSQARDSLDRANETIGSLPSCCFIFLECYNGKLPEYVRIMRDFHYNEEPALATGYKKMAKWLVPIMRKVKFVAKAVNTLMVKPISRMGLYHTNQTKGYSLFDKLAHSFWFNVWRQYAKI